MNKELKTKLDALPKSWNDVSLEDYNKLLSAGVVANEYEESTSMIDIPLSIIATLTATPIEDLEDVSYAELVPYIQNINWFYEQPKDVKPAFKCKDISSISYAEFTSWMNLKDEPYKYVNELLPIFYSELQGQDINKMSVPEINGLFFFALKKLRLFLKRSRLILKWQQAKMKVKNLFQPKTR